MCLRDPTAFFQTRANLLPAALAGMETPLGSVNIGEQRSVCVFAKEAVARFGRNWHEEFFLAFIGFVGPLHKA